MIARMNLALKQLEVGLQNVMRSEVWGNFNKAQSSKVSIRSGPKRSLKRSAKLVHTYYSTNFIVNLNKFGSLGFIRTPVAYPGGEGIIRSILFGGKEDTKFARVEWEILIIIKIQHHLVLINLAPLVAKEVCFFNIY